MEELGTGLREEERNAGDVSFLDLEEGKEHRTVGDDMLQYHWIKQARTHARRRKKRGREASQEGRKEGRKEGNCFWGEEGGKARRRRVFRVTLCTWYLKQPRVKNNAKLCHILRTLHTLPGSRSMRGGSSIEDASRGGGGAWRGREWSTSRVCKDSAWGRGESRAVCRRLRERAGSGATFELVCMILQTPGQTTRGDAFPHPIPHSPSASPFLASQSDFSLGRLLLRPPLDLVVLASVEEDLIGRTSRGRGLPSFMPVVADGIAEDGSVVVEARGADGRAFGLECLEARLGVLVPKGNGAVAAGGGEGAVDGVETDGIHRK